VCLSKCGLSSFPLRLPPFVKAAQAEARRERAFFLTGSYANDGSDPAPPGTVYLWDEALASGSRPTPATRARRRCSTG